MLGCKHIRLERQYRVAFIPATVVIKPMTFRGLAEGELWLVVAEMHSHTLHFLQSSIVYSTETNSKLYKYNVARRFFFFFFFQKIKKQSNSDRPNNAKYLCRQVPIITATTKLFKSSICCSNFRLKFQNASEMHLQHNTLFSNKVISSTFNWVLS